MLYIINALPSAVVFYTVANYINIMILVGLHTIAAIRAKESYENISIGFKDVFESINSLITVPVLIINGETYEVEIFFVADYKVATIAM